MYIGRDDDNFTHGFEVHMYRSRLGQFEGIYRVQIQIRGKLKFSEVWGKDGIAILCPKLFEIIYVCVLFKRS